METKVENIKELTKDIMFNEKGESLTIFSGVDILNFEVYELYDKSKKEIDLILKQLQNVIDSSNELDKEYNFSANCDFCIDIKFHECLSGYGMSLYIDSYQKVLSYSKNTFKRGFEYVDKKFRKHSDVVELPRRGTSKSSGYDFIMPCDVVVKANSSELIFSDVKAYMMDDEELLLFPRSSMAKHGIELANTIGKIDSDYYQNINNDGNIGVWLKNTSDIDFEIKKGDRVCQASFYKYLITDDDKPVSNDRIGGMGSTGK